MIAGIDGCRGGWIAAMTDSMLPARQVRLEFCPRFREVLDLTAECKAIAVDMPIGIPSGMECRDCDILARGILKGATKGAASRVFLTPPRECLAAQSYPQFLQMHGELRHKGVSKQTWAIVPKIREVDEAMVPDLQQRVFEFHPELAWRHAAGRVLRSKHTVHGLLERLALIEPLIGGFGNVAIETDIGSAKLDDVLDAIIGLGVADAIAKGPDYSRRIPAGDPPLDERGLRMKIWH